MENKETSRGDGLQILAFLIIMLIVAMLAAANAPGPATRPAMEEEHAPNSRVLPP